ncbi:hypothetical protein [Mucilaginibacter sp. CSA2-8R]|uniref:hypothetical protein n=1 Tax=Mucilaginibacter sp. CSA2-8R TaxID=3141542 RepID=UPI00315D4D4B
MHHTHGINLAHEDRNFNFKAFNFFTKLNLNGYKFTEERIKNYYIKSWKSSGVEQIRMYEVHSSVHVDTAVMISIYSINKKTKYPVQQTFNYRSYFLFRAEQPNLHFTINVKGDVMAFDVGKHAIGIMYEDVAIGEELPDAKALRKILH